MKSITQVMQNLVKPYIDNKDKAYAANIAPVEVSPAEAAHTAGTQLIYNGVLYDVTADIAINDDLATEGAGANISAASKVTEQISSVNEALTNEVSVRAKLGAHNLFNYETAYKYGSNISYAFNADGSVTISGTPTETEYIEFRGIRLPKDKYILSGAQSIVNMRWDTITLFKNGSSVNSYSVASQNNYEFDTSSYDYDSVTVGLKRYQNNVACSGTLYPMIRIATDTYTEYTPHAMTNRELTNAVKRRTVLSISANQYTSYALAIGALNTAYNALSTEEKIRAHIKADNNIFNVAALQGTFMTHYITSTAYAANAIRLQDSKYYEYSSSTSTITDLSSNAQNASLELYLL